MKKFKQYSLSATALALMCVFSGGVLAHAEYDKPRYVSPDGKDKGSCETVESACATIAYAADQANKGDVVLLAGGSYDISDPQSLFYLVSGVIPVKPGYDKQQGYQVQNIHQNPTWLTKAPVKYASELRAQGFRVNTDQKAMTTEQRKELDLALSQFEHLQQAQSDVPCVSGSAGQFECQNVDLLGHVPLGQLNSAAEANDIWGFVDLNNYKEYALIALNNGLSVVDVTVPESPIVVGSISAQSTSWRDIKVYQRYDDFEKRWKAYGYLTADGATVGLMIIDLTNLPNSVSVLSIDSTDASAHNAYMSNVDYATGVTLDGLEPQLHIAGATAGAGAFKTFGIKNDGELNIDYAPTFDTSAGYSHDLASAVIDDQRVGSQCIGANGKCTVIYDFNVAEVILWEGTNSANPRQIGRISGSDLVDTTYIHSGWSSEDNTVLFVQDELDERATGKNTTLQIFDISDLNNPQPLSIWTGPSRAIDHNGFVRGNRYYMSNYTKGLTILDISNPQNVTQVGMFDTYPLNNSAGFNGAWGVYPYLPSGNILVSDLNSGLYILKDKTVGQSNQDSVSLSDNYYAVDEGEQVNLIVKRIGNVNQAATVSYETQIGSASQSDFEIQSGELSWAAGDSSDKIISLQTLTDSEDDEPHENLSVRLFAPSAGFNLATPNRAVVNINGIALTYFATIGSVESVIKETDDIIMVPVHRGGDSNQAFTINYNAEGSTATEGADFQLIGDSLTWQAGDNSTKHISIDLINDGEIESDEQITLNLVQSQDTDRPSITLTLRDDEGNQGPTLTMGDDVTVSGGQSFSLTAVGSDPEGYPLTYQWQQTAGTDVLLSNATSSIASAVAPNNAQTLTFNVIVSDDFGVTTTGEMSVTVEVSNNNTPPPTTGGSSSGGGGGSFAYLSLLGLSLIALRRRKKLD